jgi:hypothetical protein
MFSYASIKLCVSKSFISLLTVETHNFFFIQKNKKNIQGPFSPTNQLLYFSILINNSLLKDGKTHFLLFSQIIENEKIEFFK